MVKIPKEKEDYEPVEIVLTSKYKTDKSYIIRKEKSFLVARDEDGKIYTRKKFNEKTYKEDLATLKAVGSFNSEVKKYRINKVYEISQSPSGIRYLRKNTIYYYDITIIFDYKGQEQRITARSRPFTEKSQIPTAREQAMDGAFGKVAKFFNDDSYDADEGKYFLRSLNITYYIEENISYYKDV